MTNLLEYLDKVTQLIDLGESVDVVLLDFSKAFDRVDHETLLIKLNNLGIGGKVLAWIKAWLSDRRQRVCLPNGRSELAKSDLWSPTGLSAWPAVVCDLYQQY